MSDVVVLSEWLRAREQRIIRRLEEDFSAAVKRLTVEQAQRVLEKLERYAERDAP